ncbi:MAG: hypothetical protein QXX68_01135 [Candidatus Pacearchaeota archaeon]
MKKKIATLEISLMVLAIFSFAYLISEKDIKIVSAQQDSIKGCCRETKEGAICQEIPFFQSDICKENLFLTSCSSVDECRIGCCYSPSTGTCSMNSPKQKCLENGGNWSDSPSCNIPQCQLGCCILGTQVSLTNSRECTLLANKYNFEKKFVPLASGESCEKYFGLEELGACLSDSGDFSGEKNCVYTSKKNCKTGDFKPGYLCTAKELKTVCKPTKKTTCVEDKDQVYFVDSCGNIANIYDASKADDQSYWEKPIPPENSCSPESPSCGNCNYIGGSVCTKYEQGKTPKPTFGDYVCKSLHCGERKHGESWCVYDINPLSGISPVGSRHFIARCFEEQITIEGCADFMQEICAQNTDSSSGYTSAKCLVNDWRSCLNANDAESYEQVKQKCDENPQCIMFNEFYGEDKLKRSDDKFLAGFDPEKTNAEQGAIDDLGKDQNKVLAHCVPRFTPGFQFWTTKAPVGKASQTSSSQQQKTLSSANYGGSEFESTAVCSLGSFVCISQIHRDCTLAGGCGDWKDHERNWECNIDGVNQNIKTKDLPALMAALNERCRAIGTCGVSSNIVGKVNNDNATIGFTVKRMKIDKTGKQKEVSSENYTLSEDYISSIKKSISQIKSLKDIASRGSGLTADAGDTAGTIGDPQTGVIDLNKLASQANVNPGDGGGFDDVMTGAMVISGLMALGGFSALSGVIGTYGTSLAVITGSTWLEAGAVAFSKGGLAAGGYVLGAAAVGAVVGYQIGKLISKNQDWSPGKSNQFNMFMASVGAAVGAAVGIGLSTGFGSAAASGSGFFATAGGLLATNPIGWIVLAAAIVYTIYTAFFDEYEEQEYFIMQFSCQSWKPPKESQCELCNEDVRPCSEYRCKSLGARCHYFVDKGEPGYCATINEIWQAKITPWPEILTQGNSYTNIRDNGFRIAGPNGGGVEPWQELTFGIITDKPATCKIDYEHTKNYDEMKFEMISEINPQTGKAEGTHHKITLSPYLRDKTASTNTLGLSVGEENEYYIRCMNFAGQVNEAEFVVQIKVKDSYDLTPAELKRFEPASGSYLKKGTNSTAVILYLNEPAECRFIQEYDVVTGEQGYEKMPNNMTCLTSQDSVFLGEWRCFTLLSNLEEGQNKFYFRCKDKPDLTEETEFDKRNPNLHSKEYILNVCREGININLINRNTFIEEKNFTLSVSTSGCLGNAICSYKIENFSSGFINFYETGGTAHSQLLMLPQGKYSIDVKCEDEAKNINETTFNFQVFFDEQPPIIVRTAYDGNRLSLQTDEDAECFYHLNYSEVCEKSLRDIQNASSTKYLSKTHSFSANPYETYYIKCRDKKLNEQKFCISVKPINLK